MFSSSRITDEVANNLCWIDVICLFKKGYDKISEACSILRPHLKPHLNEFEEKHLIRIVQKWQLLFQRRRTRSMSMTVFKKKFESWLNCEIPIPLALLHSSHSQEETPFASSAGFKLPTNDACCLCSQLWNSGDPYLPTNQNQSKSLATVLNLEANSPSIPIPETHFMNFPLCSHCAQTVTQVEAAVKEFETIQEKVKAIGRFIKDLLIPPSKPRPLLCLSQVKEPRRLPKSYAKVKRKAKAKSSLSTEPEQSQDYFDSDTTVPTAEIQIKSEDTLPLYTPFFLLSSTPNTSDPNVVSVISIAPVYIQAENVQQGSQDSTNAESDCELVESEIESVQPNTSLFFRKPLKYSPAFTQNQIEVLVRKYEEQKDILVNTRVDDPSKEVRQGWQNIANAVSEVENGYRKTAHNCWKKLLPKLIRDNEDEENAYTVETGTGPVQLKHSRIQIPKCDDPTVQNDPERLGFIKTPGRHGFEYTYSYEQFKNRQQKLNELLGRTPDSQKTTHIQKCHFSKCNFGSYDSERIARHYRRIHERDPRPFKCTHPGCEKSFRDFKDGLKPHREAHEGLFRHICTTCGEKFVKLNAYNVHIRKAHSINPPVLYKCSHCSRTFITRGTLKQHEQHSHAPKTYICHVDGCNAAYSLPSFLTLHQRRSHKDIYPHLGIPNDSSYICEQCGRTFKRMDKLKNHLLYHQGITTFSCSEAGCTFKTYYKKSIQHHKYFVHEITEKKFICKEINCESKFKLQSNLDAHMNRSHPPPGTLPKFICQTCGLSLANHNSLRNHITSRHEKTRLFVCTKCSKAFATNGYLQRHYRSSPNCTKMLKEPGPKAVYCEICQQVCSNNNGLKRHMILIHGQEADKGYVCDTCGRRYPIRMYLTRHKKYWKEKNKSCLNNGNENMSTVVAGSSNASSTLTTNTVTTQDFPSVVSSEPQVVIEIDKESGLYQYSKQISTYDLT